MAPKKPLFQSREPTKEKQENEEPSSSEEDDDETQSGSEDSSDEEKENATNGEDEGSSEDDDEEEDHREKVRNSNISTQITKPEPKSVVRDNGSDSEPQSEGSPPDYKLQRISKSPSSGKKRTHQESDDGSARGSKRSKIEEKKSVSSSATPGGGMGCITRLWSTEDEIAVLNGMIDFKNVKGLDPYADMGAFYSFIKGKLQVDYSRDQLRTKISRMKKRFLNALKKGEKASNPVSSKPHGDMAFELSKKIWGGAVGKKESSKSDAHENAKKDIVKAEKVGVSDKKIVVKNEEDGKGGVVWSKYPFFSSSFGNMAVHGPSLGMSEVTKSFVKERLSLIGNVKAKELDEKWKQLFLEEMELNRKIVDLMNEQVKMAFKLGE